MRIVSRAVLTELRTVVSPCQQCSITTVAQPVERSHPDNQTKNFMEIPGPSGIFALPIVGMRLQFQPFSKYDIRKITTKMEDLKKAYGPVVRMKMGLEWSLYLFDPSDIEKVFRADQKFPERRLLPILSVYDKRNKNTVPSLANVNGKDWHEMRIPTQKIMLRPKAVTKYASKISKIADDFVAKYENKTVMENLPNQLMEYSAEGVGMLCFNTRLGCITKNNTTTDLMRYTQTYLDCLGNHLFHVIPSYMFYRTKFYRKFEEAANYLYGQARNHIERTMEDVKNGTATHEDGNLLLDLLSTPGLTPAKVQRTIVDVFIGGIDSTANSMTFLLFQLAKNQDKQEKLFEEIRQHVPQKGPIEENTINKLVYLKACLKESFRMVFPIAGGTLRVLDRDITLQGYNVPKGTPMQLCSGIICRDEQYFPQQDQFIPERWVRGETRTDVNPFAHLPFGFGPRKCIGQRFAEQEIHICTAKIIRNYRVMLPPGVEDIPYRYSIFATPIDLVSYKLEKRDG